jgi:hypothetical protein
MDSAELQVRRSCWANTSEEDSGVSSASGEIGLKVLRLFFFLVTIRPQMTVVLPRRVSAGFKSAGHFCRVAQWTAFREKVVKSTPTAACRAVFTWLRDLFLLRIFLVYAKRTSVAEWALTAMR